MSKSGAFSGPDTVADVNPGEPERLTFVVKRAGRRWCGAFVGAGTEWSRDACGLWYAESSTGSGGTVRVFCACGCGPVAVCGADGARKRLRSLSW